MNGIDSQFSNSRKISSQVRSGGTSKTLKETFDMRISRWEKDVQFTMTISANSSSQKRLEAYQELVKFVSENPETLEWLITYINKNQMEYLYPAILDSTGISGDSVMEKFRGIATYKQLAEESIRQAREKIKEETQVNQQESVPISPPIQSRDISQEPPISRSS